MPKTWRSHPEICYYCGADMEIFTDEDLPEGFGQDLDQMRCTECPEKAQWNCFEDGSAYATWDD